MLKNTITAIAKKYAMTIGSKYWREGIEFKTTNISSWFIVAGLWHLSFSDMQHWLKKLRMGVSHCQSRIRLG